MSEHTPEPWDAVAMSYYYCGECNEEFPLHPLAEGCPHADEFRGWDLHPKVFVVEQGDYFALNRANAERIVACVNALAGMNPAAVAGLVDAAREASNFMERLERGNTRLGETIQDTRRNLRAKSSALEGEG